MKRVLLIEDDATLRENTAELLELENYKVIKAINGKEGLDFAKKELPDVIVCDIMMPKLDGYGVLEGLSKSERTKYIPFIFLSAKTERKDVRKGMNLGADDYITKPFEEEELLTAIESRLAKAAIIKEQRSVHSNKIIHQHNDSIKTLEDLKEFINSNKKIRIYKSGEVVYDEGNHANNIYLIKSGVIKSHKIDEFGKELITKIFKMGEFFGYTSLTENMPYLESATAMEKSEIVAISKDDLKKLLKQNHKLTLEFIQLLADNLIEFKEQLLQMAYGSVKKKTASTILQFTEKIPSKSEGTIKISRSDLASVAGIATESLIRTLSSLKKDGLIDIEGRNITVLDVEKLKRVN
jgi:DNA-binding response OmpR family regulator/DNA-dependent RNA polymerase auxiliary subunit epsilon